MKDIFEEMKDITNDLYWKPKKSDFGIFILGYYKNEPIVILNGHDDIHRYYRCKKNILCKIGCNDFRVYIKEN